MLLSLYNGELTGFIWNGIKEIWMCRLSKIDFKITILKV